MTVTVRPYEDHDLAAVTAIYDHHVRHGTGSFEETPPDEAEIAGRFQAVRDAGLPILIAEVNGTVAGYAYGGVYKARSAYRFTVEDSIYVSPDHQRMGVARALLTRLISDCRGLGKRTMIAVIGDSTNAGSVGLHEALGFRNIGTATGLGYKFGRWLDVVYMQLDL